MFYASFLHCLVLIRADKKCA
jgi:hypothetical protein